MYKNVMSELDSQLAEAQRKIMLAIKNCKRRDDLKQTAPQRLKRFNHRNAAESRTCDGRVERCRKILATHGTSGSAGANCSRKR